MGDGGFGLATQIEESAYFGESEGYQSSVNWWRGVVVGSVGGSCVALVSPEPPFLAWCAVMVRNECVSMARVMCRCQALYFLTPIVEWAFQAKEVEQVARLLERRDTIPRLIAIIDMKSTPQAPPPAPQGASAQ